MKKKNRDSQKAAELLQKLQEAVLSSSQKKDAPSEEPDRDELEFQKKIASMLSRVTGDRPSNEKKKKTAKPVPKQTELPPPQTVEGIAETVEEVPEPTAQEAVGQPKKKKAKRTYKRLASAPVKDDPEPIAGASESDEPSLGIEEPLSPPLPETEEPISPLPAEETENVPTTDTPAVSEEAAYVVEPETEELPIAETAAPKPTPAPISFQPKKPLVTVIKPKPFEPTPQKRSDDTIVIRPKNSIRSAEPIVIKPKKPSRATEPIRVEVKTPCQIPQNGSDHPQKKMTAEKT